MNDYYTIISVNTLKKDLKDKDSGEIPPLPAFKTQSNVEVIELPPLEDGNKGQNFFLLFGLIVFLLIIIYVLVRMYLNITNQNTVENSNFSISNLLSKKDIKKDENGSSEVISSDTETKNIDKELLPEDVSVGLLKLATPKSLEKCIKSFLEITQEK